MTDLTPIEFLRDGDAAQAEGRVAVILGALPERLGAGARAALQRLQASDRWDKLEEGGAVEIAMPQDMAAEGLIAVKLAEGAEAEVLRRAGAAIATTARRGPVTLLAGGQEGLPEVLLGLALRAYDFTARRGAGTEAKAPLGPVTVMSPDPDAAEAAWAPLRAVAEGTLFTRDLVNEPANVLTTTEFAARLEGLRDLGVEVEILEEAQLEALGMGALLGVGQGSSSPTKVAVMQWNGGTGAPFAFVGKGVVFDTGGISLKPSAGMEAMTMDMGGAGVVAGVMKTLAMRGAKANVVGLVGLVENMPSGDAIRPGDVLTSMKGDTIEIISTDAEGRLLLADVLWYAQERFKPRGIVDLATLTGAMLIALGHEMAGVFSNDDGLAGAVLKAADAEGEGAWRMPMGPGYDKLIKSRIADMKNTGGRPAGSITAAQFLRRFVKDDVPWVHLDIAGVAFSDKGGDLYPNGPTGWGVRTLNRLIAEGYEG
ncbi:leucyl aminopeptidase [Pseudoroseicyclus aestuarii]|uniref:Probable cytosol aminopeptidase n=1 Tax=Pseudoroseicyclus aestuarii TaxID=1795041 RepID=A0A318SNN8_9RHOB|nr:leucyl aminopeptidase [Pseudoroseicyclus aestuarii]PYE82306.1 leucyl aminopeptidase [Pseudoroseicyclus aestuarii]